MRFEYFQGKRHGHLGMAMYKNRWYWRLRCTINGKITADGAQGYATKYNVKRAIATLQTRIRGRTRPLIPHEVKQ